MDQESVALFQYYAEWPKWCLTLVVKVAHAKPAAESLHRVSLDLRVKAKDETNCLFGQRFIVGSADGTWIYLTSGYK